MGHQKSINTVLDCSLWGVMEIAQRTRAMPAAATRSAETYVRGDHLPDVTANDTVIINTANSATHTYHWHRLSWPPHVRPSRPPGLWDVSASAIEDLLAPTSLTKRQLHRPRLVHAMVQKQIASPRGMASGPGFCAEPSSPISGRSATSNDQQSVPIGTADAKLNATVARTRRQTMQSERPTLKSSTSCFARPGLLDSSEGASAGKSLPSAPRPPTRPAIEFE